MQELQYLFALMLGTRRKFVDPTTALELLKGAFRSPEEQQVKAPLGSSQIPAATWPRIPLARVVSTLDYAVQQCFSAWLPLRCMPKIPQPAERFNLKAVHNSQLQKS